jgi:hypothetical protein
MNPIQMETQSQNHVTPKAIYEKPMVTTFGTVAKLTMSGGATVIDVGSTRAKST